MALQFPQDLQPWALDNLPVEYYEAILRKYAGGSDKPEILAMLHEAEEYLSNPADPLEQQVKQLRRKLAELFSNPLL